MKALILGATKGLGKEIVQECLNKGLQTIEVGSSINDKQEEGRIFLHCNLTSAESVSELLIKLKELGSIQQFFWVAGRLLKGDFKEQAPEEIQQTIDINFRNVVPVVQFVWQQMQESQEPCHITIVSSSSGKKPREDEAVYVACKFAQVGFAKSLGLENKNPNLKISLVQPGGMKTQLWDQNPTKDYDGFLDPAKVAQKIMSFIEEQAVSFAELEIPRGSL